MIHLRDWTPVPRRLPPIPRLPVPQPGITRRFHAKVRPARILPPLVRVEEEVVILAHIVPSPPESESEDDDIIIVRHVLPPPRPAPPPPPPFPVCDHCRRPLCVGWCLPCGHAIDDRCYLECAEEPPEDHLQYPGIELDLECPAYTRGDCEESYRSVIVMINSQWQWRPKMVKGVRRYRVW
ncbi:hypothetical protein FS749_008693 [Ceratobasidium sp. UAMH 11750]|nr:hypothetical protein FS749_008693 [Ceratobasidium sp. UAMH 11750]